MEKEDLAAMKSQYSNEHTGRYQLLTVIFQGKKTWFLQKCLISRPWWGKKNTRRIGIPYNTSKEVHKKGPGHAERIQTSKGS